MSGTPEKILELLLEAMRPDSSAHDPTGRGRRHPACFLTQRVVSTAWERARHPASDLIGCSIGLFGQLARSFRFCVLACVGSAVTGTGCRCSLACGGVGKRGAPVAHILELRRLDC